MDWGEAMNDSYQAIDDIGIGDPEVDPYGPDGEYWDEGENLNDPFGIDEWFDDVNPYGDDLEYNDMFGNLQGIDDGTYAVASTETGMTGYGMHNYGGVYGNQLSDTSAGLTMQEYAAQAQAAASYSDVNIYRRS